MIPVYKVMLGDRVVIGSGDARLVEITVNDEVGWRSDTFSLVLEDSDGRLELPRRGVELRVMMGGGVLADMGNFYVDAVMISGAPNLLRIDGRAAAYVSGKAMQGRRSMSYEGVSLGELVRVVAGRYGLEALVSKEADGVVFDHVDQCNESDLAFLNRAAQMAGFIVKPCAGRVLVDRRFSGRTVSGKVLASKRVMCSDATSWSAVVSEREGYGAVVAEYRDTEKGGVKEFVMGAGEPELRLPHVYANKYSAKRGAETKLRNIKEGMGLQVEVAMPGDVGLFSGLPVSLVGFRAGVDGDYFIQKVVHKMGRSGFVSTFTGLQRYVGG